MGPRCLIMSEVIPRFLFIAGILAAALSAQPRLIRMTGHVHPMAKVENGLGPVDASVTLPAITLVLRPTPEQRADLDRLLDRKSTRLNSSHLVTSSAGFRLQK